MTKELIDKIMKQCIGCSSNSTTQERTGMRCLSCGGLYTNNLNKMEVKYGKNR